LKRPTGALVSSVSNGSPAAKAGLKAGDLITAVDGQPVDDPNAFGYRFGTKPVGGTAQLTVLRRGRELVMSVALQVAPEGDADEVVVKARSPFQGATFVNIGPALADRLHLSPSAEGVAVTNVPDGSVAAQYGFQPGDVIVAVNGTRIARTRDLERVAGTPSRLWRVTIERGGQQISAVFGG